MKMRDKRMSVAEMVASLSDGMTIGIGGWGSRRKPMAVVREILRSDLTDLTLVSYGGPDAGLLLDAGKVNTFIYGFCTLDSVPLEPLFQRAREQGSAQFREWDEGMFQTGLKAAAQRVPFLPMRAGLGSAVTDFDASLKTVRSPYPDEDGAFEELLAVPALRLDAAFVHMDRADAQGNAQYLGPDPYFDDLFALAADRAYVTAEQIIDTQGLTVDAAIQTLLINRAMVTGVAETPGGGHFTDCSPTKSRDEKFQKHYAQSARDPETWQGFKDRFLSGSEEDYQAAVAAWAQEEDAS